MIIRHKISYEQNEEILSIFIDSSNEEFANESNNGSNETNGLRDQIREYLQDKNIYFKGNVVKVLAGSFVIATLLLNPGLNKPVKAYGVTPSAYIVQAGDSLYKIAHEFGITVTELMDRNHLTSDVIYPGETLNVGQAAAAVNTNLYTVQPGDSLYTIAKNNGTSAAVLQDINNITGSTIYSGQTLLVNPNARIGIYTVQPGDSLWKIAQEYGMSLSDIQALNNNPAYIYPGQKLKVIQAGTTVNTQTNTSGYTVQAGDSLWRIASKYNMTVAQLQTLNNLATTVIYPGQELNVAAISEAAPAADITVQVMHNGTVQNIPLEHYVIGVVAGELGPGYSSEVYKAQALAARTYAMQAVSGGIVLADNNSSQVYLDTNQMQAQWGAAYTADYNAISSAVMATAGQVIEYNGQYIDAVFFSTSNGMTEDPQYVWGFSKPYLQPVSSPWDVNSPYYYHQTVMSNAELAFLLGVNEHDLYATALSYTPNGSINYINIGGTVFNGMQVYQKLGLNSADFTITFNNNGTVTIDQFGWGHMVGLSQYGAVAMANLGYNYEQIIHHYYTGVEIVTI